MSRIRTYLKSIFHLVSGKKSAPIQKVHYNNHQIKLEVAHGPFQGLVYPSFSAAGSTIYPKLIGCYEKELWPILDELKKQEFKHIINIGAGEGYYAVGLAKMFPDSKVSAYDNDTGARQLCQKMIDANQCSDRVSVHGNFGPNDFKKEDNKFIFCDCEGFEKKLFNASNVSKLKNTTLLIETHDFIDRSISKNLKSLFESSHDIESIFSISDQEKIEQYQLPELENKSDEEKIELLQELRPEAMEWLFLVPKS